MTTLKSLTAGPLLALSVAAGGVNATDWAPLTNINGNAYFLNTSSIRSSGGLLRAWTMIDQGVPKQNGARSSQTAFLVNCQTWEWAVQSSIDYSDLHGQGAIVHSIDARPNEIKFAPAAPGTVLDEILSIACKSKQ